MCIRDSIMGKKGRLIWTAGDDEAALAEGARDAYLRRNLRYSQLAPLSMFEEKNTRSNMPAQVELHAQGAGDGEDAYKFLFIAKGGGSANKAFLFQATPSILTRDRLLAFLKEKVLTLGTAACPPYHLAIVIGGTSAELTMKTVKLASCKYYDTLPDRGSEDGHAFRDREMETEIQKMTQSLGVGAGFFGHCGVVSNRPQFVIAGLDPAIHVRCGRMDARVEPAHDEEVDSNSDSAL